VTAIRNNHAIFDGKGLAKYTMAIAVMMTGVPAHKIRKFEEFGLCNPCRTESRQRLYSDNDIELIRQIALLEKEGINLPGIKVILEMKNQIAPNKKGVNQ